MSHVLLIHFQYQSRGDCQVARRSLDPSLDCVRARDDVNRVQQLDEFIREFIISPNGGLKSPTTLYRCERGAVPASRQILGVTFFEFLVRPTVFVCALLRFDNIHRSHGVYAALEECAKQVDRCESRITEHDASTAVKDRTDQDVVDEFEH